MSHIIPQTKNVEGSVALPWVVAWELPFDKHRAAVSHVCFFLYFIAVIFFN